jgi:hypothetical protein
MTTDHTIGHVAAWFVLGQARIIFGSTMVEHRTAGLVTPARCAA